MARRRAFTLIELLVVILIIALLIAVSVMVGRTVVSGGKRGKTEDTLRVLDVLLNDIVSRDGTIPSPYVEDPHNPGVFMPIIDGRNMARDEDQTDTPGFQMINSVGLFLFQLERSSSSMEALEGLDAQFRRLYTPYSEDNADGDDVVHEIPTIFDAWGNPIRYVHPAWDGAYWGDDYDGLDLARAEETTDTEMLAREFNVSLPAPNDVWAIPSVRRNIVTTGPGDLVHQMADSDGGTSPNQRPYFYSAGPDGKVGFDDANGNGELDPGEPDFNEDNIYTTAPRFKH